MFQSSQNVVTNVISSDQRQVASVWNFFAWKESKLCLKLCTSFSPSKTDPRNILPQFFHQVQTFCHGCKNVVWKKSSDNVRSLFWNWRRFFYTQKNKQFHIRRICFRFSQKNVFFRNPTNSQCKSYCKFSCPDSMELWILKILSADIFFETNEKAGVFRTRLSKSACYTISFINTPDLLRWT